MSSMHERASLIDTKSVLAAAEFFNVNGRNFYPFKESTRYDLIIDSKHYPPKAIFAKAYSLKSGIELSPYDFVGAAHGPVHQKFKELGFVINNKRFYEVTESQFNQDDVARLKLITERRGQSVFRNRLLEQRGYKCEVTGTSIVELLEAAHIVPHAEGANYNTSNGLLLRADIHTLYDLNLLSIDENLEIHLAPSIKYSKEYGIYDGKSIKAVNLTTPSPEALEDRHERFLEKHFD